MFPMWFFIVLLAVIGYLLYVTRPSEVGIADFSRNGLRKLQYWLRRH
jgi:hypothetical protein